MLVEIDLADPLQAAALLHVQRLAYQQEAELIAYPDLPPLRQTLPELMDCGETVLGWRVDGELLGAIGYTLGETALDICRLVVTPAAQHRGIGRTLLRAVLVKTDRRLIRVMTAQANLPALALYQQAGFVVSHRWHAPDGLALVSLAHPG